MTQPRSSLAIEAALSFALWFALPNAALAKDETRARAADVGDSVASCADDASLLRFAAGERHAVLQDADADAVTAAIVLRYPAVEQDGFKPETVVLWKRPTSGWVYLALMAKPEKAGELCFTATFSANRFDLSLPLLRKYFNVGSYDE